MPTARALTVAALAGAVTAAGSLEPIQRPV